jgi:GTP-binding protein Era
MQPESGEVVFRAGFVAIAGSPNVGKSTLLNRYLGQLIAAVSPRPQTTRRRQLGILTTPQAQAIFVDTPGIHAPQHPLSDSLNAEAGAAIDDADVLLAVFDISVPPTEDDRLLAQRLEAIPRSTAKLVAVNKIDLVPPTARNRHSFPYRELLPTWEVWEISATRGDACDALLERILTLLPEHPPYYPEEQVTETYEREIAADLIRAAAMRQLHDEVPHALGVRIDEFRERGESGAYLAATLFVERESQKGIVIGKGGERLKQIGTDARRDIEAMSGRSCYLDLRVRVLPNWRNDPKALADFGYDGRPIR